MARRPDVKRMEMEIVYCRDGGHAGRADWMDSGALTRAGDYISTFKLTPGEYGKFDITIDGELLG